jgi:hypothetical protein
MKLDSQPFPSDFVLNDEIYKKKIMKKMIQKMSQVNRVNQLSNIK